MRAARKEKKDQEKSIKKDVAAKRKEERNKQREANAKKARTA